MKGFILADRAPWAGVLTAGLLCVLAAGCQTDSGKMLDDTAIRYAGQDNGEYNALGQSGQDGAMVRMASYDYASVAQTGGGSGAEVAMVRMASYDYASVAQESAGSQDTVDRSTGDIELVGANKWDVFMSDAWALPGVAWEDAQTVALKP